ncbi:hypothetical protein [Halomonas sp. BC04]|uniref:hypothetical protein n=1 Tax=Halomonas sp. BC04 TaxID=1403540 RepID=UPI0012DFAE15|nr:hypothetical protein [Halomonas sp. BC04]
MSSIELNLFRIKFVRPRQSSIFDDGIEVSEIFKLAINAKPSSEFRRDYVWHIGNIKEVDEKGGSFAVGRTTKTTLAKYDNESGDFVEEYFEESPYTICLYDLSVGVVAIARKSKLAQTPTGIANKLKKLLAVTSPVLKRNVEVRLDPIPDPKGFIKKLLAAHKIQSFSASFTGPNPVDADELFQKPLSVYCQAVNGEGGRVITEGESLNQEAVVSVTKSVAATGNEASARILEKQGQKTKRIRLKGDPLKLIYEENEFSTEEALEDVRLEYLRVRGNV